MVVRELVALLGIKTDPASQQRAEGGMAKLVKWAKVAAAAFAALKIGKFFLNIAKAVAQVGDRIDKMSKRTGIATETLQGLGHAAELSGANLGDIEMSVKRLQAAQADAAFGLQTYTREFERLGVEIKNENGEFKDTTELLLEVADGMKGLESDTDRTAVAVKLLGRSGTNLIPLLKQGSAAIREQMGEMADLGALMDKEMIDTSAEFIDNQQRLKMAALGVRLTIGRELLPVLIRMQEATIEWWKANKDWIALHIAPIFKRIGQVVGSVASAFGELVTNVVGFVDGLDDTEKKGLKIGAMIAGLAALILAGPIGQFIALAAVIGLVIDDFMTWRKGGKSVIGEIVKRLDQLLDIDIVQWAQTAWEAVSFYFGQVIGFWRAMFETFFAQIHFFVEVWDDPWQAFQNLVDRMQSIWGDNMSGLIGLVQEMVLVLQGVWVSFTTWFDEVVLGFFRTRWPEEYQAIKDGMLSVVNFFGEVWGGVAGWFDSNVIQPIANMVSNLFGKIKGPLQKAAAFFGFGKGGDADQKAARQRARQRLTEIEQQATMAVQKARAMADKAMKTGTPKERRMAKKRLEQVTRSAMGAVDLARQELMGPVRLGAGVAPGGAPRLNQTNSVNVTVNGGTGSPQEVAAEVAKQVSSEMKKQNREALQALVPEAP